MTQNNSDYTSLEETKNKQLCTADCCEFFFLCLSFPCRCIYK